MSLVVRLRLLMTLLFVAAGCSTAVAQKCLEYGPTVSLQGTLRSQVFAGPPNYESIRRGDRKETAVILTLIKPACMTGNDPASFNVSETSVREMQLVVTNAADWKTVRRRMHKGVVVTGTLFHAHTGHHRTKVLINVADIRANVVGTKLRPPREQARLGDQEKFPWWILYVKGL